MNLNITAKNIISSDIYKFGNNKVETYINDVFLYIDAKPITFKHRYSFIGILPFNVPKSNENPDGISHRIYYQDKYGEKTTILEEIKIEYCMESYNLMKHYSHSSLKFMVGLCQFENHRSLFGGFKLYVLLTYQDKEYRRDLTEEEEEEYYLSEDRLFEISEKEQQLKDEVKEVTLEELEKIFL